ncbi:transposase, partial [bacterium]|nr:transposase [bacterium]
MAYARLYQLSHCTYVCKYHLVWTPKYRGKVLADRYIKQELKRIFKFIARWKGFVIEAWYVGDDLQYIYKTGYTYKNTWIPYTLAGGNNALPDWIIGTATATVPEANYTPDTTNFLVAYICSWN